MRVSPALDAALALARTPALAAVMRAQAVPHGAQDLLRVLAGEADVLSSAKRAAGVRGEIVFAAAELYVQQVLLHPGNDAYRMLGLPPNAERALARVHFRLLLSWLHPDKNASAWRSAFTHRVIAAWKEIAAGGRERQEPRAIGRSQSLSPASRGARRNGLLPWVPVPLPASSKGSSARRFRPVQVTFASAIFLLAATGPADSLNAGALVASFPEEAFHDT